MCTVSNDSLVSVGVIESSTCGWIDMQQRMFCINRHHLHITARRLNNSTTPHITGSHAIHRGLAVEVASLVVLYGRNTCESVHYSNSFIQNNL